MHVKAILDHAGRDAIDFVLVNSAPISPEMQEFYAAKGAYPVEVDEDALNALGVGFVKADIISETDVIHHDPDKLSRAVMRMIYGLKSNTGLREYYIQEDSLR
jgi:2-phospho-L-lactate transferase/gluconeogenesis factor (CofD/UPF0052 family)